MISETRVDAEETSRDPLVERLRGMQWPDVEPGMRERSWEGFMKLVDDGRRADAEDGAVPDDRSSPQPPA